MTFLTKAYTCIWRISGCPDIIHGPARLQRKGGNSSIYNINEFFQSMFY